LSHSIPFSYDGDAKTRERLPYISNDCLASGAASLDGRSCAGAPLRTERLTNDSQ
jgi:hypothetical protein